ncbi:adenine phosphoribosyltransferase [Mycobacterium parmense]|uniref:Adenine phosphoribosyltransferase n=1 Tax=Mycobacterium parmense TaxID=185642 RepID=A0A7I7YSB0_9MYCO|nr:adenine phosphoribosyltransferase [Mycobacterium parmense]MCV7351776.1 adenine phosphoribosyltransferase [Mycobacterium parmense]ORW63000.1 adenine phosphoribosyltransferase [Mycobacterium parmense]BBZ44756.1 adenine phosphoribosyltransferase [Mycobacterium parmense]
MGVGAVTSVSGTAPVADLIASLTREVADFPEPGIQFKDLTPVFADAAAMTAIVDALAGVASGADLVAGIDSRGFLVAAAVADRLRTGVLAIRKGGKLPPPVYTERYDLEYGSATLEIAAEGIDLHGRDVVIVDDVLATGGTLAAACRLLERGGARVPAAAVVMELTALGGREAIAPLRVHSLSRA